MIITAIINTPANEKLIAIGRRNREGKLTSTKFCDWNTVPGTLRIFSSNTHESIKLASWRDAVKYIFSL